MIGMTSLREFLALTKTNKSVYKPLPAFFSRRCCYFKRSQPEKTLSLLHFPMEINQGERKLTYLAVLNSEFFSLILSYHRICQVKSTVPLIFNGSVISVMSVIASFNVSLGSLR